MCVTDCVKIEDAMFNGYTPNLATILLFVAVLLLAWVALRFLLRLAVRIFTYGCAVILLIGIVLLLLTHFAR